MRHLGDSICAGLVYACLTSVLLAQPAAKTTATVPRLVKFSGLLADAGGKPLSGVVGVTFALYEEEQDGAPLWMETQNVQADGNGHYTATLGATRNEGIPAEVFASGQGRWLGVQPQGEPERPRVPMTSVPYALKAVDAETLGGLPASAFALSGAANRGAAGAEVTGPAGGPAKLQPAADATPAQTGSGTTNYITIWTGTTTLGSSKLYQTAAGNVGLGTTAPTARLEAITPSATGTGVLGYASSATGANFGVTGKSASSAGTGVRGEATATSGANYGVYGSTASPGGSGVNGVNAAASGGNGVYGQSAGAAGNGVFGIDTATSGFAVGVNGQTNSPAGTGVNGLNLATNGGNGGNFTSNATSGPSFGVSGSTSSTGPGAAGVNGIELAATGTVVGVNGSTSSTGAGSSGVLGTENATSASGNVFGVSGSTTSPANGSAGVFGNEEATTGVVYGVSGTTSSTSTNAMGVSGYEGAATGQVYGVNGNTSSTGPGAAGVNGYEGAATGVVYGVSGSTSSTSNNAAGVSGFESATTGEVFGVTGSTNSPTSGSSGVNGFEGATGGGPVYGVSGYAAGTGGIGVFGSGDATSGFSVGVEGATSSPGGMAGQFVNLSGSGLVLVGQSGSSFTTVFTVDASGNGTFAGNLNVTGKLTKGSGSFKIDHPLDPANKYLSHSFVESPDMMDVYNGVTRLDAKGQAWVNLPDYFEALNGDFRYQLTAIGAPAPRLYVAQEVSHNRFKIAGGRPGGKVSWQVTGIRHDAYANAHRIPVTEDKPAAEQGTYLHPDVFGPGDQSGVSARPASAGLPE